jgi:ribose transport system permease protein
VLLSRSFWARWAVIPILILLLIGLTAATPDFFTTSNLSAILIQSTIAALVAIGQAFVMIAGGIDLSVGATIAFVSVIVGMTSAYGWPAALVLLCGLLAGCGVGLVNGLLVTRVRLAPFIITLATLSILSGLSLVLTNANPVPILNLAVLWPGSGTLGPLPAPVLIVAVIVLLTTAILGWLPFGTHVIAIGTSEEAARRCGIATQRVKLLTYIISGTLAGLGGIILAGRLGAAEPAEGTSYLLTSIAAAVIGGVSLTGGVGTIPGPVLGALLLGTLLDGLNLLNVQANYQPIAEGIVVILSVFLSRFQ